MLGEQEADAAELELSWEAGRVACPCRKAVLIGRRAEKGQVTLTRTGEPDGGRRFGGGARRAVKLFDDGIDDRKTPRQPKRHDALLSLHWRAPF